MRGLVVSVVGVVVACGLVLAQQSTVSGTLTYRERIALPSSATVEVTIEDVSRADVPAVVVLRERMAAGRQVPIPFEVAYDTNRIEPTHRYVLRARISDGDRVLFTSPEPVLVITQGHPSRVAIVLRAAQGASAPRPPAGAGAVVRPPAALPPAVELRNLPATFAGTIPCADCPGIRYQLNLMPDDTFMLRMTYTGKAPETTRDEVGSWVLSSDRRALAIKGDQGPARFFAIRDGGTLRMLDGASQPIASTLPHDLHRSAAFEPLAFKGTVRGVYRASAAGRTFTPCVSGRTWTVAAGDADARLAAAYGTAGRKPGDALLLDAGGHLQSPGSNTFVIDDPGVARAGVRCEARFASAPLEGPVWKLSWIGGATFAAPSSPRNHPTLTFRADTPTFSGNGGCNRLTGRYEVHGDEMQLAAAGTLMACIGSDATEAAFKAALAATRTYRVLGRSLELYGDQRQLLARFDAS
jgi:copper homeostasis protein (lipoprotein)